MEGSDKVKKDFRSEIETMSRNFNKNKNKSSEILLKKNPNYSIFAVQ